MMAEWHYLWIPSVGGRYLRSLNHSFLTLQFLGSGFILVLRVSEELNQLTGRSDEQQR